MRAAISGRHEARHPVIVPNRRNLRKAPTPLFPGREGLGVGARSAQCYARHMSRRVPFDQTQRARALRNSATKHERKLWGILSRLRPKFTRQLPIGPYFADFACRQAKLIVELDGS